MACLPICDALAAIRHTSLILSGMCDKTMHAVWTNFSQLKNIEVKSDITSNNVQASTFNTFNPKQKFQKIETLKLTSITHFNCVFFKIFFILDISANWNMPVLQRNAHSPGETSMLNHPQCIAQVNKTQFLFTIPLIGQNKNYQWMSRYLSY